MSPHPSPLYAFLLSTIATFTRFARKHLRFGYHEDGGLWSAHWQNLTLEDTGKEAPSHGRAWVRTLSSAGHFEWKVGGTGSSGFTITFDDGGGDEDVKWSIGVPGISLYFGVESALVRSMIPKAVRNRNVGLRFFDDAMWWNFFTRNGHWSSETPKWRDGNFRPIDALLGARERQYVRELKSFDLKLLLPEGEYVATIKRTESLYTRPRWFGEVITHHDCEFPRPLPVPGKGENSYDCDEDAVFSMSIPGRKTLTEIETEIVGSILRTRERRASRNWRPEVKTVESDGDEFDPNAPAF
jgi:hypothetical protein